MKRVSFRPLLAPAVLAVVSGAGLVLALVRDGWTDALALAAVAAPVAAIAWAMLRRRA